MRLWSYGTSPHGLGLTDREFWMLTPREYYALQDVQQADTRRWAITQALTVNMQLAPEAVPFTADDFLGRGDRQKRVLEKQESDWKVQQINRKLNALLPRALKPGEKEPDSLPMWARKNPPKPGTPEYEAAMAAQGQIREVPTETNAPPSVAEIFSSMKMGRRKIQGMEAN